MKTLKTKKYMDGHCHSTWSDGELPTEKLVIRAKELGLSCLIVTDHNIVNPDIPILREKFDIELPTGCEFSCQYKTIANRLIQVHVNGFCFESTNTNIQRILHRNQNAMRPYLEEVLVKLRDNCGIDLGTYDSMVAQYQRPNINRKHIALAITQLGYSENIEDAFNRFLGNRGGYERPAYVSSSRYFAPMGDVIQAITSAGGIASLNHLYDYVDKSCLSNEEVHGLLAEFKKNAKNRGAMEVLYGFYTPDQTKQLEQYAHDYSLLWSCGSDYHGDGKIPDLGKYPYEIYEKLLEAMQS